MHIYTTSIRQTAHHGEARVTFAGDHISAITIGHITVRREDGGDDLQLTLREADGIIAAADHCPELYTDDEIIVCRPGNGNTYTMSGTRYAKKVAMGSHQVAARPAAADTPAQAADMMSVSDEDLDYLGTATDDSGTIRVARTDDGQILVACDDGRRMTAGLFEDEAGIVESVMLDDDLIDAEGVVLIAQEAMILMPHQITNAPKSTDKTPIAHDKRRARAESAWYEAGVDA